jgi:hypothetical protein
MDLLDLRRKLRISNANKICVETPILEIFGFTKLYLRQFDGTPPACSLDLDRALADFRFMPVFTEHILHESSDVACHVKLPPETDDLDFSLLHARLPVLTQIKRRGVR